MKQTSEGDKFIDCGTIERPWFAAALAEENRRTFDAKISALRCVPGFNSLPWAQLEKCAALFTLGSHPKGHVFFPEQEHVLYVLASGTASMLDGGGSGDRSGLRRQNHSSTVDVEGAAPGLLGDAQQQPWSASPKINNKVEQLGSGRTKLTPLENSIRGRRHSAIGIESSCAERSAERRAADDDRLAAKLVRESTRMKLSLQLDGAEDAIVDEILEEKEDGAVTAGVSQMKMGWKKASLLVRAATSKSSLALVLPDVKGATTKADQGDDSSSATRHPPAAVGTEEDNGGGGGGGGGGWGSSSTSKSKNLWSKLKSSIVSQAPEVINRQPGSWTWDSTARNDAERKFQELDTSSSSGGGVVLHTLSKARPIHSIRSCLSLNYSKEARNN